MTDASPFEAAIERVVSRWRANGIRVNPGATPAMLERLEQQVGTRLPDDVCSFFALANGMEDSETEGYWLSFWSIDKIISQTAELRGDRHLFDPRDTPIADVLINSSFVFFRRLDEGRVGVWVEGVDVEFASLELFFAQYEQDPESLGFLRETTISSC